MGRVKLKIEKLPSSSARQVTFSKRKTGLMKKARELSILCDIDVALVMFSPSGKSIMFVSENNDLCGVIERFSKITIQERIKRKVEVLQSLRKAFMKLGQEIDMTYLLGEEGNKTQKQSGNEKVEELKSHIAFVQSLLSEKHHKLSSWTNTEEVNDLTQIITMEGSVISTLEFLRGQKAQFLQSRLEFAVTSGNLGIFIDPNEQMENMEAHLQLGVHYPHSDPGYEAHGFDLNVDGSQIPSLQNLGSTDMSYDANYPSHCQSKEDM